ncbi:50S ribosomal protein L32 [Luteipulveratus mongoliensis]|uniref:Large ribosomal subunit protein bL32 n=1 Tax=Luteipulveratus mongoliensis TaxID=571913 RepID=A0A0K1JG82_9MICO|nr:50S ribosomal protein L32 [Luteipulveratus mongoliensis]AKU15608.1 50S ribosomal protein L32 [Luteipulveratus mongoliensis]
MAVPKRKTSRSNTRSRRANWKATPTGLVPIAYDGEVRRVPRRFVRAIERGFMEPPEQL